MSILEKMEFFWSLLSKDEALNNITWKRVLDVLDIDRSDHGGLGFSATVSGEKLVSFIIERHWLTITGDELSQNVTAGTERSGRAVSTLFSPFCFEDREEMDRVEWDFDESLTQLPIEELERILLESLEMQDGSIPDVVVFFEGFFDSVCFRADVEEHFGITFPPFSEWLPESMAARLLREATYNDD